MPITTRIILHNILLIDGISSQNVNVSNVNPIDQLRIYYLDIKYLRTN